MLWLYRLLFPFVLVALSPAYLLRMRRRGGYGQNFKQRFGFHPRLAKKTPGRPRIWLQAVSVGEMLAIGPLLEGLRAKGAEVYLTTTTSTGYRIANDRYLPSVLGVGYFPIDWLPFSAAAWGRIDPDLVILTEGERWPEHVRQAHRRGVRVVVVNARLSDRSYRRMKRFALTNHLMVAGLDRVLASSPVNAQRFIELGCPKERVVMTGNLKLDVSIPLLTADERAALAREAGLGPGLIVLGSSTWTGEEEALVEMLRQARAAGISCSLLLVPRHAERRTEIEKVVSASGFSYRLRSRGPAPGAVDIVIADTTGELRRLTQLADLVFIGKSLLPNTEGQTPVEAIALGKAVVLGPGMANFREISRDLVARGAALQVADRASAIATLVSLAGDAARRGVLSAAAVEWTRANTGAVQRTLALLGEELARTPR